MQTSTATLGRTPWRARLASLQLPGRVPVWALATALFVAFALMFVMTRPAGERTAPTSASDANRSGSTAQAPVPNLSFTTPQNLMPIAPEDALAINAARPISAAPVDPALPLVINKKLEALRANALQCLTSALYYEAASESDDGQRAVAQVVLNRVRHPAYPSSVCGVVFQGSERVTGCQFSFTCDGSLGRTPSASGWARSRRLAEAALSGKVFAPVGHSTHYHADYVVPYWAASLDKVQVIGRHIFYRWSGRAGRRSAFRQHYAAVEQLPAPYRPPAETLVPVEAPTALAEPPESQTLTADGDSALQLAEPPSKLKSDRAPRQTLLADAQAGKLVPTVGGRSTRRGLAETPVAAAANDPSCNTAQPAAPVQPIGGNVARAREPVNVCS